MKNKEKFLEFCLKIFFNKYSLRKNSKYVLANNDFFSFNLSNKKFEHCFTFYNNTFQAINVKKIEIFLKKDNKILLELEQICDKDVNMLDKIDIYFKSKISKDELVELEDYTIQNTDNLRISNYFLIADVKCTLKKEGEQDKLLNSQFKIFCVIK